jgi:hypothetical protein
VAGQYADIIFNDQRNFSSAMHRVVAALKDPELPVRVDSVVALRSFVESCKGKTVLLLYDKFMALYYIHGKESVLCVRGVGIML